MNNEAIMDCANPIMKARPFANTQLQLQKHSPEILVGVGIVGVLTATVLACRATLKTPLAAETARGKFEDIREARDDEDIEYSDKDYRQDIVVASTQTAVDYVKIYGVSAVLMAGSLYAILKGHGITMQRNVGLSSAVATVSAGYKAYRNRVRDEFGEDAELNVYHGRKTETIEVETVGKDGKTKTTKEKVTVLSVPKEHSAYARFFDDASRNWMPSPEMNLTFLRCQQNYANDKLRINKHLFLNEVYDMLGIPRTSEGQVVGWVIGEHGDNFVDFGLYETTSPAGRMFINGQENAVLLDFNVDGVVFELI